jgi:hypothetical protein
MPVKLLFLGHIICKPRRQAVSRDLHKLVDRYMVDLVIANCENAAGGFGITEETANDLYRCGIHVLTSGNHIWDKKDSFDFINREDKLLRPANYPEGTPGRGSAVYKTAAGTKVAILNLEGRVFMNNLDCPFRVADREIGRLQAETPIIFVDFHAEATSEKTSLGWYLDGRVSALIGTHTHIQTADERILPGGTAYLTDAGMTGGIDSVIGVKKEEAIAKFLTQLPAKFDVAKNNLRLNGVVVAVDERGGQALSIERINICCE